MNEDINIIVNTKDSQGVREVSLEDGLWYVELASYRQVNDPEKKFYVCAVLNSKERMNFIGGKTVLFHSKYKTKKDRPLVQVSESEATAFTWYFLTNSALNFGIKDIFSSLIRAEVLQMHESLIKRLHSNES